MFYKAITQNEDARKGSGIKVNVTVRKQDKRESKTPSWLEEKGCQGHGYGSSALRQERRESPRSPLIKRSNFESPTAKREWKEASESRAARAEIILEFKKKT